MCAPHDAPACSPRHDGSRLISAYWFSQLPLSAQMTLLVHGRVLNPFGLTVVELNRKKRKDCCTWQDNQGSQQIRSNKWIWIDLDKGSVTFKSCCAAKSYILGIFPYTCIERIIPLSRLISAQLNPRGSSSANSLSKFTG